MPTGRAEIKNDSPEYDEMIQVVDELTGEPLADFAYMLETEGHKTVKGRTDANGCTIRIKSKISEKVYVFEEGS